jgi:hypothetical protein
MSHEMSHHAELKIFFELLHMFELVWIWIENPRENKIEKPLEIPEKKKKAKSAHLGLARACTSASPLTGGPRLSAHPARALSPPLSLAAQWGRPIGDKLICMCVLSVAVLWAPLVSPSARLVVRFH